MDIIDIMVNMKMKIKSIGRRELVSLVEMESKMEKGMICDMEGERELFIGKRGEVERILKVKIEEEFEDEFGKVVMMMKCESEENEEFGRDDVMEWYVINGNWMMDEMNKWILSVGEEEIKKGI